MDKIHGRIQLVCAIQSFGINGKHPSVAERKSRLSLIALAANKAAQAVKEALVGLLSPIADQGHTLTYDNGKEFAYHESISEILSAPGYFAPPYHS